MKFSHRSFLAALVAVCFVCVPTAQAVPATGPTVFESTTMGLAGPPPQDAVKASLGSPGATTILTATDEGIGVFPFDYPSGKFTDSGASLAGSDVKAVTDGSFGWPSSVAAIWVAEGHAVAAIDSTDWQKMPKFNQPPVELGADLPGSRYRVRGFAKPMSGWESWYENAIAMIDAPGTDSAAVILVSRYEGGFDPSKTRRIDNPCPGGKLNDAAGIRNLGGSSFIIFACGDRLRSFALDRPGNTTMPIDGSEGLPAETLAVYGSSVFAGASGDDDSKLSAVRLAASGTKVSAEIVKSPFGEPSYRVAPLAQIRGIELSGDTNGDGQPELVVSGQSVDDHPGTTTLTLHPDGVLSPAPATPDGAFGDFEDFHEAGADDFGPVLASYSSPWSEYDTPTDRLLIVGGATPRVILRLNRTLPRASWISNTSFASSSGISPYVGIYSGDEPVTAYYEYGGTPAMGKQTDPQEFPAHSNGAFYPEDLGADFAGGPVYYKLVVFDNERSWTSSGWSITRGPAPVNIVAPKIVGAAHPGSTITCDPGAWNISTDDATYSWSGFGDTRYAQSTLLTEADLGRTLTCSARLSVSRVGSATAVSEPVVVTAAPPSTSTSTAPVTASSIDCKLPRVNGKTLAAVKSLLARSGCGVRSIRHLRSRRIAKGRVIAAKRVGNSVYLVVSKGKPKPRKKH